MDPPSSSDLLLAVSETWRIIAAHSRHFLCLSVLFLLPLSSLLLLLPASLRCPLLYLSSTSLSPPSATLHLPLLYLAYSALLLFLALSAAATLSRSIIDGFFGRSVRLAASLRPLPSLLPRLATTLACAAIPALLLSAAFFAIRDLIIQPPPLPAVSSIFAAILVLLGLYLASRWAIFPVVVVAESAWGLAALRRADKLLPGFRTSAAMLVAVPVGVIAGMVWAVSLAVERDPGGGVVIVAVTIAGLAAMMVVMLYGLAASAVMYMYCKAVQGELEAEIAAEFGQDYVFLPFDERKVPHVVSIVRC